MKRCKRRSRAIDGRDDIAVAKRDRKVRVDGEMIGVEGSDGGALLELRGSSLTYQATFLMSALTNLFLGIL